MNRSLSDEERVEFMRESMANESVEPWTCAMCHVEQEKGSPYYFTQHGIACLSCFESFMGIAEDEDDEYGLLLLQSDGIFIYELQPHEKIIVNAKAELFPFCC